ncbi:hypothetical protein EBT25_12480 [bacterium]|nr:hypothetical protein [bacterium]
MSIGYTLSESEYNQVQGQYYTEYQFFNCVADINGVWFLFLSDEDKQVVATTEYAWVLDLPEAEYVPPPPPPFPPTE